MTKVEAEGQSWVVAMIVGGGTERVVSERETHPQMPRLTGHGHRKFHPGGGGDSDSEGICSLTWKDGYAIFLSGKKKIREMVYTAQSHLGLKIYNLRVYIC